jgi:hypothetical protein
VCDDGDACTVDICIDGRRCESSEAVGVDSVTCACQALFPTSCRGLLIPQRAAVLATKACSLFDKAALGTGTRQSTRQLVRGAKLMRRASTIVGRAGTSRKLSQTCATELVARLWTHATGPGDRQTCVSTPHPADFTPKSPCGIRARHAMFPGRGWGFGEPPAALSHA